MIFCGHGIEKATHGRKTWVFAAPDPMYGHADDRPADDGQVERRVAVTHPAAVFSGNDVQSLMQPVFDAPILAIGLDHLLGVHLGRRTRGDEKLNFGFFGRLAWNLNPAREPGRLFRKGKVDATGTDSKGFKAPLFGTPAIDLRALGRGSCVLRGKKRATDLDRVVARSSRLRADCP